jgi:flagellin
LAIGKDLESRVSGLNQSIRNANDAISMVQIAEGSLDEATSILQRMRDLAVQAANGSLSSTEQGYLDEEHKKLAATLDAVIGQASFNNQTLLSSSDKTATFQIGADKGDTLGVTFQAIGANTLGVDATQVALNAVGVKETETFDGFQLNTSKGAATFGTNIAVGTGTGSGFAVNDVIVVKYGTAAATEITLANTGAMAALIASDESGGESAADRLGKLVAVLNEQITNATFATTGTTITVENASNTLTTGVTGDAATNFKITMKASPASDATITGAGTTSHVGAAVTTENGVATSDVFTMTVGGVSTATATGAFQTNKELATALQATNTNAAFEIKTVGGTDNGNIIAEYLVAGDKADAVFSLTKTTHTASGDATGDTDATGTQGVKDASTAITDIDAALAEVAKDRAALGASQAQLESTVRNLANVAENTAAAQSRIMDTDYAAETANLTKAQILQQAATSILAQANAQPQAVLSLLQ